MVRKPLAVTFLAIGCAIVAVAFAESKPVEMKGGKDHPLVSRYAGAVLQDAAQESFVALRVPGGPGRNGAKDTLAFDKATAVEGRVSSYFYVAPKDRTALEVFRNYQVALQQSGFSALYACEMRECDQAWIKEWFTSEVVYPRKWSGSGMAYSSISRDLRFASAKLNRNGTDVYVMLFVAEPSSLWGTSPTAVLLVVEPAAMDGGKVVVDTSALQRGLASDGKIALYGLYFDTGKAEVKPESKPQLAEMAKLLQATKALKVLIVGHTDNVGAADANLALSQRRAEAVVAALVADHQIDAARLRARGVANFAPVTSNAAEAGRAKNRRVELVEQ
jgi:OmpA-OmpF porin, OOP family